MFSHITHLLNEHKWRICFVLVLAFTLLSRLMQPDWYNNKTFHPDERWLAGTIAPLVWPELPGEATNDPAGLQYGSLPLYSAAATKALAANWGYNNYLPFIRGLTGIIDTLTVAFVFVLGCQLFNRRTGLIAAALAAFTPLHIQLSHFFVVDPWMTLFAVLTLCCCAKVHQTRSYFWSVLSGLAYAAALTSKTGALPLLLPIMLAHYWPCFNELLVARQRRTLFFDASTRLLIAGIVTITAFLIFMPMWHIEDWQKFFQNQSTQQNILVKGAPEGVPFVRQFLDTSWFYHIKNLVMYYQGYALGITALLATIITATSIAFFWLKKLASGSSTRLLPLWMYRMHTGESNFSSVLLLSWIVPYFVIVGILSFAKFARYLLPILPMLTLLAAALFDRWLSHTQQNKIARRLTHGVVWGVLGVTFAYGIAYVDTYSRPHPWISTSSWMLENNGVPPEITENKKTRKAIIYNESWGDDLPVDIGPNLNAGRYDNRKLNIVEADTDKKLTEIAQAISQADAIVMADARAYGTYLRQPQRYPLTYTYFYTLMTEPEKLGFELAHQAQNHMKLFGLLKMNDSRTLDNPSWKWSDESFTLYDRPHPFIFKKIKPISEENARRVLTDEVRALGLSDDWLMENISPEENYRRAQQKTNTTINPNLGTERGAMTELIHPIVAWWLIIGILSALAVPLCSVVFKNFPDKGYAFSKPIGVLLFAWLAYNLSWLNVISFYQTSLWLVLAIILGAATVATVYQHKLIQQWFITYKKEILITELLFNAAFFGFIAIRSFNPNIHDLTGHGYFGGGEPLGITYLNTITRSSTFPAYNPWLSLAHSTYYYFGYVIAGTLTKLSGFAPAITYNLSLGLFFALTVISSYGICRALVKKPTFAVFGAIAIACFGALNSVYVLITKWHETGNFFTAWFSHQMIWDPTRFPNLMRAYIYEFPYFSYLYGDLHPHNMVISFSLTLVALLLVPFKNPKLGLAALANSRMGFLLWLLLTALLLDAQYAINSWSWPIFAALGLGAMMTGLWAGKSECLFRHKLLIAISGAGVWAVVLILGRILFHGFHHYFIQDSSSRIGSVLPQEWTMPGYIPLAYFGYGLMALSGLCLAHVTHYAANHFAWTARWIKSFHSRKSALAILLAILAFGFFILVTQGPVIALAATLAIVFFIAFCCQGYKNSEEAFLWMLATFVMVIVCLAEIKFVADRMNTIFKFWINGWLLMGVVFAAGFAKWIEKLNHQRTAYSETQLKPLLYIASVALMAVILVLGFGVVAHIDFLQHNSTNTISYIWLSLLLLLPAAIAVVRPPLGIITTKALLCSLIAVGMLYPIGATVAKIMESNLTPAYREANPRLNGMAFLHETNQASNAQAIDWLNKNAKKTEVLLELPGLEMYQDYSLYSTYTGLPTLVGWRYQIGQQLGNRNEFIINQRVKDALTIYQTSSLDEAKALLDQYQVRWVVISPVERRYFEQINKKPDLKKFAQLGDVAYKNEAVIIYRINN